MLTRYAMWDPFLLSECRQYLYNHCIYHHRSHEFFLLFVMLLVNLLWYIQLKEKMLELELANLKMQQHQEKAAKEHTQMQLYAEQVSQLITTEKNLRLQLAADGERFQQFQVLLSFDDRPLS